SHLVRRGRGRRIRMRHDPNCPILGRPACNPSSNQPSHARTGPGGPVDSQEHQDERRIAAPPPAVETMSERSMPARLATLAAALVASVRFTTAARLSLLAVVVFVAASAAVALGGYVVLRRVLAEGASSALTLVVGATLALTLARLVVLLAGLAA